MDKGNYRKLNGYHVIFLISSTLMGFGGISLTYQLSPLGYSQWVFPFFMGAIANLSLWIMIRLMIKFPKDNLFTIHEILLGKWIGTGINIILIGYFLLVIPTVGRGYLVLMQTITLPDVEIAGPAVLLILLTTYICTGGIKGIARYSIISFFIVIWMAYYSRWPLSKGTYTHLLPVFNFSMEEAVAALYRGYGSMIGYELILIYFPYILEPKKAFKHASIGIWLMVAIYTLTCFTSVVYFSEWQMENLLYPLLNHIKAVELSYMERMENIWVSLVVFAILSTMAPYLWAVKKGADVIRGKRSNIHLYIGAAIAYFLIVVRLPQHRQTLLFEQVVYWIGYSLLFWPIVLLLIYKVRGKGRKSP